MFRDRNDAGNKLAEALSEYRDQKPLILAIPRGGVAVAVPVARKLNAELALLVSRKLPLPDNPEAGFGAITEDGTVYLRDSVRGWIPDDLIRRIREKQEKVIRELIQVLRQGKPLPSLRGRTLILIDDGLAMGSTMRASVMMCKKHNPALIIVAVPVAGRNAMEVIKPHVDRLVVLETPFNFRAVSQVYSHWHDMNDQDVLSALQGLEKN